MIKSVTVTNHIGDSIKMELMRPETSGFAIINIEGLGSVKANINMTDVATYDGGLYNSSRLGIRNIVFDLAFVNCGRKSIEDIRHEAYRFFQTKSKVKLLFETTNRILETEGYVESNDPEIFSKQEGCKVSVLCQNPYLYSVNEDNRVVFSSVEPVFEFPFSNESLTEPLLETGFVKVVYDKLIVYKGDAETGITLTIHADGEASNITLYNTITREIMKINTDMLELVTGKGIVPRDEIIIGTEKGDKYVWLLRDGKYYNIISCLGKHSDWFQLRNGDNIFAYTADVGAEYLKLTIENRVIYKGV